MTTTKRRSGTEPQPETIQQEPVSLAHIQRNPGMPLDMDWVDRVHINRSAVERRAATMSTRRTVKKEWQAAWLLRGFTCNELTTLAGGDNPRNGVWPWAKGPHPRGQEKIHGRGGQGFER